MIDNSRIPRFLRRTENLFINGLLRNYKATSMPEQSIFLTYHTYQYVSCGIRNMGEETINVTIGHQCLVETAKTDINHLIYMPISQAGQFCP